ncbi:aromatic ring-hydroxylating oxygenase subunit alpha [Dactylosporangium sp. CA-092794]|uniref:aromatic ring-hydroxylating oxygenase subunit alpha n=1 Tax=Dactylosporangium sp. CA-092794 TaxID=3239929 RepID=UPI003D92936C
MTAGGSLAPTLPGHAYTDPAVFAAEQERIFAREWMYVVRADELTGPGRAVRRQVGPDNVIVLRDRAGTIRAFLNVCRHRGARLCLTDSAEFGNAIRCPYHAWTYTLDGRLLTAPNWSAMANLDRDRYGLVPVAVAEWAGLVWVNLAEDPEPLAAQLEPQLGYRFGGQPERIERWRLGELVVGARKTYDVAANWKIIQENFQECYHCGTIHPELIRAIPTFASFDRLGDGEYHTDGYGFADGLDAFSITGQARFPLLPGLAAEDERKYFGMVLRPNCFVSLLPDHAIVHRFEPVSPERTVVVCDWLFDREVAQAPGFDPSDTVEIFHRINEQDFAASQWCQPNMTSRAYRAGGVLVPLEAQIIGGWYYDWYRSRMGAL